MRAVAGLLASVIVLCCCGGPATGVAQGASPWLDSVVLDRSEGVVSERVTYLSEGLRLKGEICRPDDKARHPGFLLNHGGFEGIRDSDRQACRSVARLGYVAAQSEYRGEGGSEGRIEVCAGEVADVQALLDGLRRQPYLDPGRVVAFGGSHGGCITLELALREKGLRAAVDYFGPADLALQYDWWQEQVDSGEPFCAARGLAGCEAIHRLLLGTVRTAVGGTPRQAPAAYAERSPGRRLAALTVPTLIVHGTEDYFVDLDQTCLKRSALSAAGKAPSAWYLDAALAPRPSGACGAGFRVEPVPATLPDPFYLFILEGQGHGFSGDAGELTGRLLFAFLQSHL